MHRFRLNVRMRGLVLEGTVEVYGDTSADVAKTRVREILRSLAETTHPREIELTQTMDDIGFAEPVAATR